MEKRRGCERSLYTIEYDYLGSLALPVVPFLLTCWMSVGYLVVWCCLLCSCCAVVWTFGQCVAELTEWIYRGGTVVIAGLMER